ncbi:uroporphyrinogen-III synthase [Gramella sp. MAR_2010_147]|uniref:uroporphyrinogen-III synthase n=1 Tax=Gramella sp. MAR_2010_147 TaxID=1250205 RepID=UPI00087BD523|nr:uroporphyrinogen-III synthase [Gramella sp. MAR_2010_147]SDS40935.1 uroporphyrinogen-III synthase [Gramella sp. MAR_2010_147]
MPTVLSTKKLAVNQKELLLNSGIGFVEYDAISIKFIDFDLKKEAVENAIFTSKNSVKAIAEKPFEIKNCFCVGDKTSVLLEEKGYLVVERAENSRDLAQKIIQKHNNKQFHFFCGNMRREELPQLLNKNGIQLSETMVYETSMNSKRFESDFDGILFFSPSAVQSFTKENKINSIAFCIGETTANEVMKHSENIIIASKPTIENVIVKVVSNLKNK